MASGLVPEFPVAVSDALEHLRELDKELREEGVAFPAEAGVHLSEMTAAITELEGHPRATRASLEAEAAANGKLAQRISDAKETARREIMAGAAAVRASGAAAKDGLLKHLGDVSQLRDALARRQRDLGRRHAALRPEHERVQAELAALVGALDDQLAVQKGLRAQLGRRQEQTEVLAGAGVAAQRDKTRLQERTGVEREALAVARRRVDREVERVEEDVQQQAQAVRRRRTELGRAVGKKQEAQGHLGQLQHQMSRLESGLERATESRRRREEELEGETLKYRHLKDKEEVLKKDLQESAAPLLRHLSDKINRTDGEIEERQAWRERHRDRLARFGRALKQQREEEGQARAESFRVVRLLRRSKLQLDRRVACISSHRKEASEMEEQAAALWHASELNQGRVERELQEMSGSVEAQGRSIARLEEEKRQLAELLDTARSRQEAQVAKVTSDIRSTKRRCQELLREEAALRGEQQQQQPLSEDADLLKQRKAKYGEEEARQREETEQRAAEADHLRRSVQEQQRQVEEEEERRKEAEALCVQEELRRRRVERRVEELRKRERDLQQTLLELKQKTAPLLQPRNDLKAQLEDAHRRHAEMVEEQARELRLAELSLYECLAKEEQVRVENSRFRLSIKRMAEDARRAEQDGRRYREEARLIRREVRDALLRLRERWEEEVSAARDHQRGDADLLTALDSSRNSLRTRREQLDELSARFQQQVAAFRVQLGDGAIPVHSQCLSAGL